MQALFCLRLFMFIDDSKDIYVGLLTNRIKSNFEEIEFHRIEFEQSRIRFGN